MTPIDVFICSFAERDTFETVVRHWIAIESLYPTKIRVHLLFPDSPELRQAFPELVKKFRICVTEMTGKEFQRGRRIAAENYAQSDVYIVADDDCLLDQPSSVFHGVEILRNHPEFAVLSPMNSSSVIYPWTPADYAAFSDEDVMEHVNVGNIRFTRKGVMPLLSSEWRPQPELIDESLGWKYDQPHAEQIRERGMRVGLMKNITFTHLGERFPIA